MKTYNETDFTVEEIESYPVVKCVRNNWRRREIMLHHVPGTSIIYSVGIDYDRTKRVICEDTVNDWARELNSAGEVVTVN